MLFDFLFRICAPSHRLAKRAPPQGGISRARRASGVPARERVARVLDPDRIGLICDAGRVFHRGLNVAARRSLGLLGCVAIVRL